MRCEVCKSREEAEFMTGNIFFKKCLYLFMKLIGYAISQQEANVAIYKKKLYNADMCTLSHQNSFLKLNRKLYPASSWTLI